LIKLDPFPSRIRYIVHMQTGPFPGRFGPLDDAAMTLGKGQYFGPFLLGMEFGKPRRDPIVLASYDGLGLSQRSNLLAAWYLPDDDPSEISLLDPSDQPSARVGAFHFSGVREVSC